MKKAIKQSLFTKIINIVSITMLIIATFTVFLLISYNNKTEDSLGTKFELVKNASLLKDTSAYLTNMVRAYAVTGDIQNYDNYWNEVNELKNRDNAVSNLKALGITDEEQKIIDSIFTTSNNLIPLEEQAMEYTASGNLSEAVDILYGDEYVSGTEKVKELNEKFNNLLEERMSSTVLQDKLNAGIILVVMILAFVFVAVIQGINIFYFNRKIIVPIISIEKEMREISKGKFSSNFNLEPNTSEIGMLIDSIISSKKCLKSIIFDTARGCREMSNGNFNLEPTVEYIGEFKEIEDSIFKLVNNISQMLLNIFNVADQVTSGSEQVANFSESLSSAGLEQTRAVDILADTIEKLLENINKSDKSSNFVKSEAEKTQHEVQKSNEKMNELMLAINEIYDKSHEIENIIHTIEDIAFQTNILALNAAVEAARAGDAGKGFAVVADEVRVLSIKSSEAAKNTFELISSAINAVNVGTKTADEAVKSMDTVVEGTQNVVSLIDEIAANISEQSDSVFKITQNIENISKVVKTNSVTAEESDSTSQELSFQAHILDDLVRKFQFKS